MQNIVGVIINSCDNNSCDNNVKEFVYSNYGLFGSVVHVPYIGYVAFGGAIEPTGHFSFDSAMILALQDHGFGEQAAVLQEEFNKGDLSSA